MAVPVHCITGLESVPMEAVTVGLQKLRRGMTWRVREDGLEPWLGPICDTA